MVKRITIDKHIDIVMKGLGDNTLRGHSTYIKTCKEYFRGQYYEDVYVDDLNKLVRDTAKNAIRRQISNSGIGAERSMVFILRRIWASAVTDKLATTNLALGIKYPKKVSAQKRRGLTSDELQLVWTALANHTSDPELAILVFRTALETGARRAELLGLKFKDIKVSGGCIQLHDGAKNRHGGEQPITESLMNSLLAFTSERIGGVVPDDASIFMNKQGVPITRRWFETTAEKVRAFAPELSGDGEVWFTWHLTRHTMATLLERSAGFSIAMRFLRHDKNAGVPITMTYTSVTTAELRNALEKIWDEPMAEMYSETRPKSKKISTSKSKKL